MSYSPAHPGADNLKKPLVWSLGFHMILFSSLGVSTYFSHRGDTWGGTGGDNAVTVGLVGKLPGVTLPRPEAVTTSRVVDERKGLYKSEPQPPPPKEIAPDTKTIPQFKKEKTPHYITHPSRVLEDPTPPPPNAVPYGQGGAPALLTGVAEIETSGSTSLPRTSVTVRVETPCTYIAASAMLRACSGRVL